jgi:ABC-type antimicrobial peptide transport system permease subunit
LRTKAQERHSNHLYPDFGVAYRRSKEVFDMFSLGYAWNELRRRWGRTLVTAFGLAAGVGLVMGIIGVSQGLSDAQKSVLSPLGTVGTDIIVTRTVAPTTSQTTTTTTTPSRPGGGGGTVTGGGGFFGRGVAGASTANGSQAATLLNNNASVITDLAKLGPAGTKFTHDFFVPGTLITFPSVAISDVAKIPGVTSAVGALSLSALHESGTVPKITDTVKEGGQTISTTVKPPTLTAAQTAAERTCIQKIVSKTFNSSGGSTTSGTSPSRGGSGPRSGSGFSTFIGGFTSNPAIEACMTPAQQAYEQKVVVPEQTITRVLNPPTTNTATSSYSVAGVDPTNETTGLITKAQLVKGTWFTKNSADEVLVYTEYATTKGLKVGGTLTINSKSYKVVGLVSPTLTGDVADVYFPLSTMQGLASAPGYVNEVLVSVKSSSDVAAVTKTIKRELPGATVLTSKQLADSVSGSLNNAHKLANDLGGVLAIVVLLAAFLIAGLLTLSSVAKRVREIGSLRAIGWTRGEVVRQVMAETIGIGIVGGVIGVAIGAGVCAVIAAVGPGLSVTSTGLAVGASKLGSLVSGATNTGTVTSIVHLTAPIHATTILIAFAGALVGGLIAGMIGGWRAARLAPASALRDLG